MEILATIRESTMTATEQKIVDVLHAEFPLTLCDMYHSLHGMVESCELDRPLLDLCERGIVRTVGKRRCMRGDNCLSCGKYGTIAYMLAANPLPDTALPEPPNKRTGASENPATVSEWTDLLAKLVHVHIGRPKELHEVLVAVAHMKDGSILPMPQSLYKSAEVDVGYDAMVTGVNFCPPNAPPRDEEMMFPHGRLSVTFDMFLDEP